MGNFSKNPDAVLAENVSKKYVGVRIEQNVPLLDRDLNLASDLLGSNLRALIRDYIGDGAALYDETAFSITPTNGPGNDFTIGAGKMLVGGIEVQAAQMLYSAQTGVPGLKTPEITGVASRLDTVYIDVWLDEVASSNGNDDSGTTDLGNQTDIKMPTSVRLKPAWQVRVAENSASISPNLIKPGHAYCVLAQILRTGGTIEASEITDKRVHRLQLADLIKRVGAVEVELTNLTDLLKPAFWVKRPFDTKGSYNGRQIVLYGKNFDLGPVQVTATNGQVVAAMEIVGEIQPTAITVLLRSAANAPYPVTPTGDLTFTVTTAFGSATSTPVPPFRNWGRPTFAAVPFDLPGPLAYGPFVIHGLFLDAPNIEVQYQNWASNPNYGAWTDLPVDPPAEPPTPTTILVPHAPFQVASFRIRMRSEVSSTWTVCTTKLECQNWY